MINQGTNWPGNCLSNIGQTSLEAVMMTAVARDHVDNDWPPMGMAVFRRHLASIRFLSDELGRPFDEIAAVYQCELLRLSAHAVVVDYLPVLVCKHVRQFYRRRLLAHARGDPCAQLLAEH
jgi:hypothetical protein